MTTEGAFVTGLGLMVMVCIYISDEMVTQTYIILVGLGFEQHVGGSAVKTTCCEDFCCFFLQADGMLCAFAVEVKLGLRVFSCSADAQLDRRCVPTKTVSHHWCGSTFETS